MPSLSRIEVGVHVVVFDSNMEFFCEAEVLKLNYPYHTVNVVTSWDQVLEDQPISRIKRAKWKTRAEISRNARDDLRYTERVAESLRNENMALRESAQQADERVLHAERRAQEAEDRVGEAERRAQVAEDRAEEAENRVEQLQFVENDEVEVGCLEGFFFSR